MRKTSFFKARLVILGQIDPDKPRVVNEAPTVLKSSVLLALSLIVSYGFHLWSRDITQAFLQRKDPQRREVFVRLPKEENILNILGAESKALLKAIKPQYGLAEAPGYWWQTFEHHHEDPNSLNMVCSSIDPCFFYQVEESRLQGVQVTQVDDSLGGFTEKFSNLEQEKS